MTSTICTKVGHRTVPLTQTPDPNILSQTANTFITNTVFGNKMELNDIFGIVAGAAAGTALPKYKAIKAKPLVNTLAETGFNTVRGAVTGVVKGGVDAIIKADFRYFYMDMVGGALSGFSRTLAVNAVFGAPYKTVSINGIQGIYRTGGLSNFINNKILPKPMGDGLTLGTDMYIREGDGDYVTMNHEGYHIDQQVKMGWAVFYGGIIGEYITQGSKNGPIEREAYDFQNKHDHLNW